jgi:hypothetical protein
MIPKICPFCKESLPDVYLLISHVSMKHENPFKEECRNIWLNPSRRDSVDIFKLRKLYGYEE